MLLGQNIDRMTVSAAEAQFNGVSGGSGFEDAVGEGVVAAVRADMEREIAELIRKAGEEE